MDKLTKYVLVVAGGQGLRMGGALPKQFIPVAGKPVLMHTLEAFVHYDSTVQLIVVLPESHQTYWRELCEKYNFCVSHQMVLGGETRFHSVRNGLKLVTSPGLVAVHDGVRPMVSSTVIAACFKEAAEYGTAIPVLPIVDSLREYTENSSIPVNRSHYCTVQTPQVFRSDILLSAYEHSFETSFTDDASVVESYKCPVHLVPGNCENIKITTPVDLLIAEALLTQHSKF